MSLIAERCMKCGNYHGCPPWPQEPLFKPLPAVESMEEVAQLRRERDALLAAMENLTGTQGLYNKYIVTKADGTPVASEADYFVLRLDTDKCARHALRVYANNIESKNPTLAADLRRRLDEHAVRLADERLK